MVFRLPILFTGLGSLKTQKQRQNHSNNIFATPTPVSGCLTPSRRQPESIFGYNTRFLLRRSRRAKNHV